jgi:hypothetical protein
MSRHNATTAGIKLTEGAGEHSEALTEKQVDQDHERQEDEEDGVSEVTREFPLVAAEHDGAKENGNVGFCLFMLTNSSPPERGLRENYLNLLFSKFKRISWRWKRGFSQ